jgi:hypothetical protein
MGRVDAPIFVVVHWAFANTHDEGDFNENCQRCLDSNSVAVTLFRYAGKSFGGKPEWMVPTPIIWHRIGEAKVWTYIG